MAGQRGWGWALARKYCEAGQQVGRWDLRAWQWSVADVLAGGLGLSSWQQAGSECPSRQVVGVKRAHGK